jgi:hypothetical protein
MKGAHRERPYESLSLQTFKRVMEKAGGVPQSAFRNLESKIRLRPSAIRNQ